MSFSKFLQAANVSTKNQYKNDSEDCSVATTSLENDIVVYSASTDWVCITDRYEWYDDFDDTNLSTVDSTKNIKLDSSQINLSQEELSQFIPFEMPRRYDNFDLALNTRIQFHYVNSNNEEDYISAVNVKYNDEKIRFALLVPYAMTYVAGNLKFEIIATGTNSKGENYKWISRACSDLNVIQSLSGNGIVDPTTTDWYTQFVRDMDSKIATAQSSADEAKQAAKQAENAISTVQSTVSSAKSELESAVSSKINSSLTNPEIFTIVR